MEPKKVRDLEIKDLEPNSIYRSEIIVEKVKIPFVVIKGKNEGPTLAVTAGIHGSEYNASCTAFTLIERISPENLSGTIIVFPLINVPAFENRSVYVCPLDGKNINRVFPGDPTGSISDKIAFEVFNFLTRNCQYLIDLHCGDLIEDLCAYASYKETGDPQKDVLLEKMARLMDLGAILSDKEDSIQGTLAEEATKAGVYSIVAECGGRGIIDEKCVDRLYRGIHNILVHLKMILGKKIDITQSKKFHKFLILNSNKEGFLLPLKKAGHEVNEDEDIADIRDYSGKIQETMRSPASGKILLVTGPPVKTGEMAIVILI